MTGEPCRDTERLRQATRGEMEGSRESCQLADVSQMAGWVMSKVLGVRDKQVMATRGGGLHSETGGRIVRARSADDLVFGHRLAWRAKSETREGAHTGMMGGTGP